MVGTSRPPSPAAGPGPCVQVNWKRYDDGIYEVADGFGDGANSTHSHALRQELAQWDGRAPLQPQAVSPRKGRAGNCDFDEMQLLASDQDKVKAE